MGLGVVFQLVKKDDFVCVCVNWVKTKVYFIFFLLSLFYFKKVFQGLSMLLPLKTLLPFFAIQSVLKWSRTWPWLLSIWCTPWSVISIIQHVQVTLQELSLISLNPFRSIVLVCSAATKGRDTSSFSAEEVGIPERSSGIAPQPVSSTST